MPDRVRFQACIHGYVQGVSFRYYTLRQAQMLELSGYVRNCEDGSVEVVAEGPREAAERLLSWLHRGPPSAEVQRVEVEWQQAKGKLVRFEVRM